MENEFQKIDTFTDLLEHFRDCLKAKRVKERPGDLGYFFMEAINEVLPKKYVVNLESPEAIEAIKKEWEKIIANAQRAVWRSRKKLKLKETTYGRDPDKFIEQLEDTEWGLSVKTKVRLPSDKLLSQKIRFIPPDEYEMEPSPEDLDYVVLRKMDLLEHDSSIREIIDTEGGYRAADIVGIMIQYRPVKISARAISERLGISKRTIERRLGWIKGNMDRIERLLEAKIKRRNPEPFISSLLEEGP